MKKFTLKQLEEETGVKPRNIRYYIAEGLLPKAEGQGRGSYYTKDHLRRLREIVSLRDGGYTMDQIRDDPSLGERSLEGTEVQTPAQTGWAHLFLTEHVQVLLRQGLKPKARRKTARALKSLAATLLEED
jgi:DNA-binding transcriptional MerR regulator